jgi:hypothetical protein
VATLRCARQTARFGKRQQVFEPFKLHGPKYSLSALWEGTPPPASLDNRNPCRSPGQAG